MFWVALWSVFIFDLCRGAILCFVNYGLGSRSILFLCVFFRMAANGSAKLASKVVLDLREMRFIVDDRRQNKTGQAETVTWKRDENGHEGLVSQKGGVSIAGHRRRWAIRWTPDDGKRKN